MSPTGEDIPTNSKDLPPEIQGVSGKLNGNYTPPTKVYIDVQLAKDEARGTSTLTAKLTVPDQPALAQYATMLPFAADALNAYRIGANDHDPFDIRTRFEDGAALVEVVENSGGRKLAENIDQILSAMWERRFRPVVGISYQKGQLTGEQWRYGKDGWHSLYDVEIRQV